MRRKLHPSEKQPIKELSLKGLGANEEILRTAFGMVAAEIAKYDWPKDWPLLVDQLNEYMHSGQENFVRGAIKCLSLFSDFLDARTLPTIGHKIFPTMNEILSKRDMFGATLRLQASKVVHSAIVEFLTVKDNENAMYKFSRHDDTGDAIMDQHVSPRTRCSFMFEIWG